MRLMGDRGLAKTLNSMFFHVYEVFSRPRLHFVRVKSIQRDVWILRHEKMSSTQIIHGEYIFEVSFNFLRNVEVVQSTNL